MKAARVAALTLILAAAAAACGTSNDGRSSLQPDIQTHDWLLDGRASTPVIQSGGRAVTISFQGRSVSGTGPCNSYHGQISFNGDEIEISGLATTLMACEPAVMRAETRYLRALEAVSSGDVDGGDELTLVGDSVRLEYTALDAEDLIIGTWHVVNVARGDAIHSAILGTDPTITFRQNGELSVDTGCNIGASTWELRGDGLEIGPVALTRRACSAPDGIEDQESALVAALERAATVDVTPDQLTILDDDGHILVVANRNAP